MSVFLPSYVPRFARRADGYTWYLYSNICYAYLDDIETPPVRGLRLDESRWFQRGWTLQELIAPNTVLFLSKGWSPIGTKNVLAQNIQALTKIDVAILRHERSVHAAGVAERMSWAARRSTSRTEDQAYCLIGIFNVYTTPIYGEGHNAFVRLQEAILQQIPDQTILAWGSRFREIQLDKGPKSDDSATYLTEIEKVHRPSYLLATSPLDFADGDQISVIQTQELVEILGLRAQVYPMYTTTAYGIRAELPIISYHNEQGGPDHYLAFLTCEDKEKRLVALVLRSAVPVDTPHNVYSMYVGVLQPGFHLTSTHLSHPRDVLRQFQTYYCRLACFTREQVSKARDRTEIKNVYIHRDLPYDQQKRPFDASFLNGFTSSGHEGGGYTVVWSAWSQALLEKQGLTISKKELPSGSGNFGRQAIKLIIEQPSPRISTASSDDINAASAGSLVPTFTPLLRNFEYIAVYFKPCPTCTHVGDPSTLFHLCVTAHMEDNRTNRAGRHRSHRNQEKCSHHIADWNVHGGMVWKTFRIGSGSSKYRDLRLAISTDRPSATERSTRTAPATCYVLDLELIESDSDSRSQTPKGSPPASRAIAVQAEIPSDMPLKSMPKLRVAADTLMAAQRFSSAGGNATPSGHTPPSRIGQAVQSSTMLSSPISVDIPTTPTSLPRAFGSPGMIQNISSSQSLRPGRAGTHQSTLLEVSCRDDELVPGQGILEPSFAVRPPPDPAMAEVLNALTQTLIAMQQYQTLNVTQYPIDRPIVREAKGSFNALETQASPPRGFHTHNVPDDVFVTDAGSSNTLHSTTQMRIAQGRQQTAVPQSHDTRFDSMRTGSHRKMQWPVLKQG